MPTYSSTPIIHCDGCIFALQRHGGIYRATRNLIEGLMARNDIQTHAILPANVITDMSWLPKEKVTVQPSDLQLRPARLFGGIASRLSLKRRLDAWGRISDGVYLATYYSTYPSLRIPQITVIHDMIYERYPDLTQTPAQEFHKAEKLASIKAADVIICPSESARDDLLEFCDVGSKTISVINWGVEPIYGPINDSLSINSFKQRVTGGAPYLIYVGGREGTKNFTPLLMAYSRWAGRHEVHLLAVGGGPFKNQENSILHALRLTKHVHCIPSLPNEELVKAYNGAEACIMPSQYEGFGFPVLEAMACGTPVATSRISSLPEVGGDVAVYFDPTDNDSIVLALDNVTDASLRQRRIKNGLVRASEFSWHRAVDKLVGLVSGLC